MPKVRNADNYNCPYCGSEQSDLYGSGSDCKDCGKYFKIGVTNGGYTSLWKVNSCLKYRVIREYYKDHCEMVMKFIGENKTYFKDLSTDKPMRDIIVKYAYSIGMTPYKITKFHRENGSKLCNYTVLQILNNNKIEKGTTTR